VARDGVSGLVPQSIKPYLTYSVAAHALAAVAALRLLSGISSQPSQVYTIDFVGPSATIQSITAESETAKSAPTATAAPAASAQAAEFDEFGRRNRHKPFVLPRPSLLRGFQAQEEKPAPETAMVSAPPAPTSTSVPSGAGGPPSAGIATDMPNFPYPWYISQVRASLWNLWSSRMPKGAGQCVIVFSILPNGGIVDLRTEDSSGDANFDLTAMSAVQDAAPFPGLPKAFKEPFLKIHVTLKSQ
jgi:TonB family protein